MDSLQGNYHSLLQYVDQHDSQNRPYESSFFLSGLKPELHILQGKIEYEKNQAMEKEKIVEYQNLSKKVQDLADRIEEICSREELEEEPISNFDDLRNSDINENEVREHFHRIADQIELLENLLPHLPSISPDERNKEIAKIREKYDQLIELADLGDSYSEIQSEIIEPKADHLIDLLSAYETIYSDLSQIYSKLQSIDRRYQDLELERVNPNPTNPISEISSSIGEKGIALLKELHKLHNNFVGYFGKNLAYFKKEELLSLDQKFSDIQEKCERMLNEMDVQITVKNCYHTLVEVLDDTEKDTYTYEDTELPQDLNTLLESELAFAKFLYAPNSEKVLNWEKIEKRTRILGEKTDAHTIKKSVNQFEDTLESLNKKPEFTLEELSKLSDLLSELNDIHIMNQNHENNYEGTELSTQETVDRLQKVENDYLEHICIVIEEWKETATDTDHPNSLEIGEGIISLLSNCMVDLVLSPENVEKAKQLIENWQDMLPEIRKKQIDYQVDALNKEIEDLEKLAEEDLPSIKKKFNKTHAIEQEFQKKFSSLITSESDTDAAKVFPLQTKLQNISDRLHGKYYIIDFNNQVNVLERKVLSLVDPANELVQGDSLTDYYQSLLGSDSASFTEQMIATKIALEKCKQNISSAISKEKEEERVDEDLIAQLSFFANNRIDMQIDRLNAFARERGWLADNQELQRPQT